LTALAVAVDLLAPQLSDRFANDRWWLVTTWLALRHSVAQLIGPTHTLTKVMIVLVLFGAWLISPWSIYVPMYRVSAPFRFVPQEKRQLASPFDGYLAEYFVLPGDRVRQGDRLARMETKELELKQNETNSRILALQRKADAFGADPGKQAERQIALAERLEAQAHLDLLTMRIDMATIVAPVDGEVLTGDLRDRVGSPFKVGEVLMEVADPGRLLVELAIQDRDIQDVRLQQRGWLATSALPGNSYPFAINRIVPLGEAKEGANMFKVYGLLDTGAAAGQPTGGQWRPGMTGEARIEINKASLFWQVSHRLAISSA
jgi:multidrug efflux pump subunit AcrA (membrane-fusion protein)